MEIDAFDHNKAQHTVLTLCLLFEYFACDHGKPEIVFSGLDWKFGVVHLLVVFPIWKNYVFYCILL